MAAPSTSGVNHAAPDEDDNLEVPFFDPYEKYLPDDSDSDEEDDIPEPYEGMEFLNEAEAKEVYNRFACKCGFSIRKNTHYKNKAGVITFYQWVCSNEGFKDEKKKKTELGELSGQKTPEKEKPSSRCGCEAYMDIKYLAKEGNWIVSKFCNDHNHDLIASPSKKRILQSQKYMTEEQKELIRLLGGHGIKPSQILEILAEKAGGKHNLCFSKKDVSNLLSCENRKLVGIDMDSTMLYFKQLQKSDPDFFFAIETDTDNAVKNVFWVNGRSRRLYREFGDVIVFDTTYSTNKYSMP